MAIMDRMNGESAELVLSGKLTFADSTEFRKRLVALLDKQIKSLNIVLAELTFMDSSGLGMLMVALKECQTKNVELTIMHPKDSVKSLLEMTKSYERFKIIN
jgi:anti-sigma B factor antagonist